MSTPACGLNLWRPSCGWVRELPPAAAGAWRHSGGAVLQFCSCPWWRGIEGEGFSHCTSLAVVLLRRLDLCAPYSTPPQSTRKYVPPCAAIAKYGKGQETDDLARAVQLLMERHLEARLPPMAKVVPNDFRQSRMYTEEVDVLLKRHQVRWLSGDWGVRRGGGAAGR
jgi:hypothetical protein